MTEDELLLLIRNRFPDPQYAFLPHVADGTGYVTRTADAIVMSVWPSRGLELMGMECKSSRSDWLRELKNPAKAEGIAKYMHRWWIVAAEPKIIQPGELPPTWGLLVPHGATLRIVTEAALLTPKPVNYSFLAAVFRNAGRTLAATPTEILDIQERARAAGYKAGERDAKVMAGWRERDPDEELRAKVAAFEKASGINLATGYTGGAVLGAAVSWLLSPDGMEGIRGALRTASHAQEQLATIVQHASTNLPPEFRRRT